MQVRKHSRPRGSSDDETDVARFSSIGSLSGRIQGTISLIIQTAAALAFDEGVETALIPVHSITYTVDNLNNIAAAFSDTGADRRLSGNSVSVPFKLNKYMLPGQGAVILFAACRLALLLFSVHCVGPYRILGGMFLAILYCYQLFFIVTNNR
jgi:hypothetical protein